MKVWHFEKDVIDSMSWLYDVGDSFVSQTSTRKIDIVITDKRVRYIDRINHGKESVERKKAYGYRCNICNDNDWIYESSLKNGGGCKCCSGRKVVVGINDFGTIKPNLVKYLDNPEDAKIYTINSSKLVPCHCPYCGDKKNKTVISLSKQGFGTCLCSNTLSYPERFFCSFLNQLGIEYIRQLNKSTFSWCENYYYDFYISKYNMIIETHGRQHYTGWNFPSDSNTRTLEEEQENDANKLNVAVDNGIDKYIVIDCRNSELDWIKKSIIESELPDIFGFKSTDVDWFKCEDDALKHTIVYDVCNYWNEHKYEYMIATKMGEIFDRDRAVITQYLKKGSAIGICDYDPKTSLKNSKSRARIKDEDVRCISEYWMSHYNEGITTETLAKVFEIDRNTIARYLKIGAEKGYCNYDSNVELAKSASKNGKASGKRVNVYKDDEFLYSFYSAEEAARQMKNIYNETFQSSKISYVCRRNRKHHRGFVFRYDCDDEFKSS